MALIKQYSFINNLILVTYLILIYARISLIPLNFHNNLCHLFALNQGQVYIPSQIHFNDCSFYIF